jgi:hypothetical protein
MSIAWNDIVTAVIAAFAASISLFTFVYQYTLKARLDAQIGPEILVHYTGNGQLILAAGFVFLNKGAAPTALTGLYGSIWAGRDKPPHPNLVWRQFEMVERLNALGDRAVYRSGSSGVVETLVIPGRGASSSHIIRLYTKEEFPLESDSYTLTLQAVDGSTKDTRSSTLTCRLLLHDEDRNELERNGREKKGIIQSRILFQRRFTPKTRLQRVRSRIPFDRKVTPIINFESDGTWSPTPSPPGKPLPESAQVSASRSPR